jgi:hypothetical protein
LLQKEKVNQEGQGVITYFVVTESTVFLISIYDKSEKENITDKDLDDLLKHIPEEAK